MVSNSIVKFLTNPANNVRGNADTIFIVLDNDDELTAYTGVENVPNIIIKDNCAVNKVEVNWVEKDGYAQYVFIDVSGALDTQAVHRRREQRG